ncbi:MAG TPA: hypothetical protein VFR06_00235 [Gallionellaceae bacterium]|nr:hypothetical protein [Gallionellaceae bacterium]
MFELTSEDALCLNVMMAGELQAVRIDASSMTVFGLSPRGTASVRLHPNCRPDQYLRTVREVLAGHALDSPGGYPVHLQRWTRMGQAREKGLDRLLLLGEPEAVTSVAYSNGLTDELARRAWWAMPVPDHARRMLERECVVNGGMGKVLADFLVDYLPFETDPHIIVDTIKILLQPGLIDQKTRDQLWNKGGADNAYLVGFLARTPDDLPDQRAARHDYAAIREKLAPLIDGDNRYAQSLLRLLSGPGQTFLHAYEEVLRYPANQDVFKELLEALWSYFFEYHPESSREREDTIEAALGQVSLEMSETAPVGAIHELINVLPELHAEIGALLILSKVNSSIAKPILSQTTAHGTLMRKKLEPVSLPLLQQITVLQGKEFSATTSRRRAHY